MSSNVRKIIIGLSLLVPQVAASNPFALTYSGRLVSESTGAPVAGPLELRVLFFKALAAESHVGGIYTFQDVPITDGVFNLTIDINASDRNAIFDTSGELWIELTDVTNGRIYPRQKMTAVPYAARIPIDSSTLQFNEQGNLEVIGGVSGGSSSYVRGGPGGNLVDNTIESVDIKDLSIKNSDISPSAAIEMSKISGLAETFSTIDTSVSNKEPTIAPGTSAQYYRGDKTWQDLTTTVVPEGDQLYFTESRARSTLSSQAPLSYDDSSGEFTISQASGVSDGYLGKEDFLTFQAKQEAIDASTQIDTGSIKTSLQDAILIQPYGSEAGNTGEIRFKELSDNGGQYVGFKAANSIDTTTTWTLPNGDGSANNVLATDGNGNLSWIPVTTDSITQIDTGTGLTGGPITATGTISLADTSVSPGSYKRANITVDQQGRITAAADGPLVDLSTDVTGTLPLANGGTGATTAADARANLELKVLATEDSVGSSLIDDNSVTSVDIKDGEIVNDDIAASAAIADTKLATIATAGKVANSATSATSANSGDSIVLRDSAGNFSAGSITADLVGNATTADSAENVTGTVGIANGGTGAVTIVGARSNLGLGELAVLDQVGSQEITNESVTGDDIQDGAITTDDIEDATITNYDIAGDAAISDTKLATIATAGKVENSATTATELNDPNTIVMRDESGNFQAGTITADLAGNASTATSATNVTGTVQIGNGGTGATTVVAARDNLGLGELATRDSVGTAQLENGSVTSAKIVDSAITDAHISSSAAISDSKLATISSQGKVQNSATSATDLAVGGAIVARDGSGNFSANVITADLNGNATSATTAGNVDGVVAIDHGGTGATTKAQARANLDLKALALLDSVGSDEIDDGSIRSIEITDGTISNVDIAANAAISDTKLATITTAGKVSNQATTATSVNLGNKIVARDQYGDFSARIITADLIGNATTADSAGYVTGIVPIVNGGTGADNATDARVNLGLGELATLDLVGTDQIANDSVSGLDIEDATITNVDIASNASIVDTKLATISTSGKVANSATTATELNTPASIVARDANGNFSAGSITASLIGNASSADYASNVTGTIAISNGGTGATNAPDARANLGLGDLAVLDIIGSDEILNDSVTSADIKDNTIVNADISPSAAISDAKLATITSVGKVANTATTANAANQGGAIVARDPSGNFSAGTITATLSGNATTATSAGNVTGIVAVANGGTGASVPSVARANLELKALAIRDTVGSVHIDDGSVSTDDIANATIKDVDIAANAAIADTKLATITTAGKVANSATTATDSDVANTIVLRDANGDFSAGTITADLIGNATTATSAGSVTGTVAIVNGGTGATTASGARTNLELKALAIRDTVNSAYIDDATVTGTDIAAGTITNSNIAAGAAIADTKLGTISTAGKVANSATSATSANTASTIVARDGDGNFTAGTITATLIGNASTATSAGNVTGTVAIANGGTGAINASGARTNLGLGTLATLNSVTSSQITNATIATEDLGDSVVTGSKIADQTITGADLNLSLSYSGTLSFGSSSRQMLNLWGTTHGIGAQTNTLYSRSPSKFAWYQGGSHSTTDYAAGTGGSTLATLDSYGMRVLSGQIAAKHGITTSRNINWNGGNIIVSSAAAGTLSFTNMVDGAGYTLVLNNSGSGNFTLSSSGITFKCNPACPVQKDANKDTVVAMVKAGNTVWVSWVKGFQ